MLYQTVRSVSKAWSYPLYGGIRQLTIDYGCCPHIPPEVGSRFASLESLEFYQKAPMAPDVHHDLPAALRHMPKLRSLRFYPHCRIPQLPRWFAELQLVELYISGSTYLSDHTFSSISTWESDATCLPRSLEYLDMRGYNLSFTCARSLPRLRELRMNDGAEACPAWLHEVKSLRRLDLYLADSVDVLRRMSLEAITSTSDLDWRDYQPVETEGYVDALERLVVGTPCGASLRELNISGNKLSHVPDCFRGLQLQVLNISDCGVEAIPSWIAELPLVALDLAGNNDISTLPASLQMVTSLRVLVLRGTNICGPSIECFDADGDVQWGPDHERCVPVLHVLEDSGQLWVGGLDEDEALAEIVRRDAILRGLSLALPDLRMMLYWRTGDMLEVNPAKDWWHARCGYDWIDPVFYTTDPTSERDDGWVYHLTDTDSLEAARARLRAARGEA